MNFSISLLAGAPTWFPAILDLSLQAALLCALVFLVTKAVGRWIPPSWRALLWFLVIVRVLVPYSPPAALSLQNLWRKPPPPVVAPALTRPSFEWTDFTPQAEVSRIGTPAVSARRVPTGAILATIWSAGTLLGLSLLIFRSFLIRFRLKANHSVIPESILEGSKIHYPIRFSISDQIAAPALTGLLPARLILPADLTGQFTPAQMRHILLHELAHIRQGHLLLHWLTLIARAVHWFNPFIHIAAARLRQECELAADAAALKNSSPTERTAYGETILAVLAHSTLPRTNLTLGMAEEARHIQQRLLALTNPTRSFRPLGAILLLALAITGLSSAETSPTPIPQQSRPERTSPVLLEKDRNRPQTQNPGNWNTPNPSTNVVYTSPSRRALYDKLQNIRIDEFQIPNNTDLVEVLRLLNMKIKKQDASGRGVNLLIAQAADRRQPTLLAPDLDVEKFQIKLAAPMRDLTVAQILDAIIMIAKPPEGAPSDVRLKYSVEDYAVVFSQRRDEGAQLFTRTYRLNPDTVRQGLEGLRFQPNPSGVGGIFKFDRTQPASDSNPRPTPLEALTDRPNPPSIMDELRDVFRAAGLDLAGPSPSSPREFAPQSKAMFYNDRTGILFLRATLSDLDKIETILHEVNAAPAAREK